MMNEIIWYKPNATPNALHTAFTHAHETLIWASKSRRSRHTFNYDLINSPDPSSQVSSVWRIPTVPKHEKLKGYHPTQKPLRLLRRALLASTREGDLRLRSILRLWDDGGCGQGAQPRLRGGRARGGVCRAGCASHSRHEEGQPPA